jgi:predicted transposase YbfD/YdcC
MVFLPKWKGLNAIGMVESTREIRGEQSMERRYYLTSVKKLEDFPRAVRRHWAVENQLHWILELLISSERICRVKSV